jgi:two-component system, NarL family, response regulator NreC
MDKKPRLVIVEDHAILREGLQSLLSSTKEFDIVGEAEDGREAIRSIEDLKPDLVLTDLSMPKMNGMDMIQTIKKQSPKTKVIALTVHRGEDYVFETLKAGADGYVLKEATYSELMMAIKSVLEGKRYVSPEVSEKLIDGYLEGRKNKVRSSLDILTSRERQILKLVGEWFLVFSVDQPSPLDKVPRLASLFSHPILHFKWLVILDRSFYCSYHGRPILV